MNIPHPCDKCKHLYVDCMSEDDPSGYIECKKELAPKKGKCKGFQHYKSKRKNEKQFTL